MIGKFFLAEPENTWLQDDIAAGVAGRERRGDSETTHRQDGILERLVEAVTADGVTQPKLGHRNVIARQVRHAVANGLRKIVVRAVGEGEAEWIAGFEALNPGQIVPTDQEVDKLIAVIQEMPASADWQLIGGTGDEYT